MANIYIDIAYIEFLYCFRFATVAESIQNALCISRTMAPRDRREPP